MKNTDNTYKDKDKIKYYATLGPSCCKRDTLIRLLQLGSNGFRLNLSHSRLADCEDWICELHLASSETNIEADLLIDLQGPELRIGTLINPIEIKKDELLILVPNTKNKMNSLSQARKDKTDQSTTIEDNPGYAHLKRIPVPSQLLDYLKNKQTVRIDDGIYSFHVIDAENHILRSSSHAIIQSRKSIFIEGISIPMPVLTSQDQENLSLCQKYGVTEVMLPFVRSARDLQQLRAYLNSHNLSHLKVYAKIENEEGLDHLTEIIPCCDHIVIARGDLGNALSLPKLPAAQKKISHICRQYHMPFMVVTQMLHTMISSPMPSRAEVTDIFQAVLDGVSSLMLTAETAVGSYPVEAMTYLINTAHEAILYKDSIL